MNANAMKKLVERFLDADTTIEEENILYEYFHNDSIPQELEQYRELFVGLSSINNVATDIDIAIVSNLEVQELADQHKEVLLKPKIKPLWKKVAITAVSIAACLDLAFIFMQDNIKTHNQHIAKVEEIKQEHTYIHKTEVEEYDTIIHPQKIVVAVDVPVAEHKLDKEQKVNKDELYTQTETELEVKTEYMENTIQSNNIANSPQLMDELIDMLIKKYEIKGQVISCDKEEGSSEIVYQFPNQSNDHIMKTLNQFAQLYDSSAEGYLLSATNKQFFFKITTEDDEVPTTDIWIAEPHHNNIYLYRTHSIGDNTKASNCLLEYKESIGIKKITLKT